MSEAPKDERYQAYLDAIRRRVCSVCLDQRDDGTCHLAGRRLCAIEAHIPRIVEAVMAIDSSRMDEYVDAIKAQVCSDCRHENLDGSCMFRERGECALWTYLPLVVGAIEEVRGSLGVLPQTS
jgi:hypothetical protein